MPDTNDMELLRDYARSGSETAFAELVRRHLNLVYSVALRHVGAITPAEEITQAVFIILARKAASLRSGTVLEGWLHTTTRLTALSYLRGERRRQFREQEAYMQSTLQESTEAAWQQLTPLLDEGISKLGQTDRDAVVLRFFKDKSIREVAATLELNEAATQRRILRAVDKLRTFFSKRGVTLTAAAITSAVSANSVQAAPVTLAKSVTAVAVAKGAAAGGSTLNLVKGALKIMAWTKAKTAIVVATGVLLATGTTTVVMVDHQTENYFRHIEWSKLTKLSPHLILRPTKYTANDFRTKGYSGTTATGNEKAAIGREMSFQSVISYAYNFQKSKPRSPACRCATKAL